VILGLQVGRGTLMRYAVSLALSMTTLTRGVVSSSLVAPAVALLGVTLLLATSHLAAFRAAVAVPAIASTADIGA